MKCDDCPVTGPECTGRGHWFLCKLVHDRKDIAERYKELAGEQIEGTAGAIAAPAQARAVAHAQACPHRTPTSTCVCSGVCALGHGLGGYASLDDCAACPDHPLNQ